MRRAGGYALTVEPGKADVERDTFTCVHCNSITTVAPFQDPSELGGFCSMCSAHICKRCAGKGCSPFMRKVEKMEARDRLRRSVLGLP